MPMGRTSKNLGFTVPPRMAEEFERVAEEEGSTKSELFRRMFRLYQSYRTPIRNRTQAPDAWVERLILEAQEAERQNPMSRKEYRAEIERAVRYGATRATARGVSSEEELNDMLYAERTKR
jgi:metal-responsive CopG/Arc/MetJ family transcriptional regulator